VVAQEKTLDAIVHSGHASRDFFNQDVLPKLLPGKVARQAKRKQIGHRGDLRLLSFKLRLEGEDPDDPRQASVTFGVPSIVEELYGRTYGGQPLIPSGGARAGAVYLPQHGCLVELFPATWRLPSLAAAMDPRRVARRLGNLIAPPNGLTAADVQIDIVRYRSQRTCVLRYATTDRQLIAKVYPPGGEAREVYQKLSVLTDPSAPLTVPAPVALVDDWDLLIMQQAPGRSLKTLIRPPVDAAAAEGMRVAARGLAHFHSIRLPTERHRTFDQQHELLSRRVARLHAGTSDVDRLRDLLHQIEAAFSHLPSAQPGLIHGDFKPSQVFINGPRAIMVDLDRACIGDPAIDLGAFVGVLHKKGLLEGRHGHGELAGIFLQEYTALAPQAGLAERARVFECMVLTRMAVSKFETPHRRAERPFDILNEAQACLQGL
jgi:Ser/Thr protein kinase RdoA (MazF antagonist)